MKIVMFTDAYWPRVNGITVSVDSYSRVLELLEDPELRRRKSNEAKKRARTWSIEELTQKLVTIYKTTSSSYREEYGEPHNPVWETLMDRKIIARILKRKVNWR